MTRYNLPTIVALFLSAMLISSNSATAYTAPEYATDPDGYCANLDTAITQLTASAQSHRQTMTAAAQRARPHHQALGAALEQYTALMNLINADSAMGLALMPRSPEQDTIDFVAIESIVAAVEVATSALLTEMQAIARADAQLESTLDQLEPLLDAQELACTDAPATEDAVATDDVPPGMIMTPLGVPIPEAMSWTGGWQIAAPGSLSMPWLEDPALREIDSAVRITVSDAGEVVHIGLGVPFGSARCESGSLGFPGFNFSGWFEARYVVDGTIELAGDMVNGRWPIRMNASVTQQMRDGDALITQGTGRFEGAGEMLRLGPASFATNYCDG